MSQHFQQNKERFKTHNVFWNLSVGSVYAGISRQAWLFSLCFLGILFITNFLFELLQENEEQRRDEMEKRQYK
jgi:hypothetical protein